MRPIICDGIAIYRNVIDYPQQIIDVIESVTGNEFNNKFHWTKSTVVHPDGNIGISDVRTNSILYLNTFEKDIFSTALSHINSVIHKSFVSCLDDYLIRFENSINIQASTNYSILKYEHNQKYVHHLDDGVLTPRKISGVGYLNDNFTGGELDFDKLEFKYYPMSGDIVLFPSVAPYSHASLPVIDGTKYSVVNWWI